MQFRYALIQLQRNVNIDAKTLIRNFLVLYCPIKRKMIYRVALFRNKIVKGGIIRQKMDKPQLKLYRYIELC